LGDGGFLLGTDGEKILIRPGNVELLSNVLGGFRHGIDAVLFFHQWVDEAPADGGVLNLLAAGEGGVGFAHHIGRAGHGFHAAGQHQIHFAGANGAEGSADCVHAGTAQPVKGGAGHRGG